MPAAKWPCATAEVVPTPVEGATVTLDGVDVTDAFTTGLDGRHLGLVTGLALTGHPVEGPLFSGPHLQPWDCTTAANGLGEPLDAGCNVEPVVDYHYVSTAGGGYQPFDPSNPPTDVATITTDRGDTVRHIVRRERGAVNRGLYAVAFLHDPALGEPDPRAPQPGWNRKLYYPFGPPRRRADRRPGRTSRIWHRTPLRPAQHDEAGLDRLPSPPVVWDTAPRVAHRPEVDHDRAG